MSVSDELKTAYLYHRRLTGEYRAAGCLKSARKDVAAGKKRYPPVGWPRLTGGTWQNPTERQYQHLRGGYALPERPGWRVTGYADELSDAVRHEGWYTTEDNFADSTIRGIVLQLPARKGQPLYVPGYEESSGGFCTVWPGERTDDKADAATQADRLAEIAAEREREYQEAWSAGSRVADMESEAERQRMTLRDLGRTMRQARADGVASEVWAVLVDRVADLRESISETYSKRDRVRDSVPSHLANAYNEGKGI